MKRAVILCIAVLTAAALLSGCAKPAAQPSTEPTDTEPTESTEPTDQTGTTDPALLDNWYELSSDDTVITVRLPGNATTGYEWVYSISDEEVLELITQEYVQDENTEGVEGAGGTYVGSFKGTFNKAGNVTLTFNYQRSWEDTEEPMETHVLELFVNEADIIEVVSAK